MTLRNVRREWKKSEKRNWEEKLNMRSTEGIRVDALETTFQTGSLMIKMACQKVSQPLRWMEGHEDVPAPPSVVEWSAGADADALFAAEVVACGLRRLLRLHLKKGVRYDEHTAKHNHTIKKMTYRGNIGPFGIGRSSKSRAIFVADWSPCDIPRH